MDCHKCRIAEEIEQGKWKGVEWGGTPCSRCHTSDGPNHKGRTHVVFTPNLHESQSAPSDFSEMDLDEHVVAAIFSEQVDQSPHSNHKTPALAVLAFMAKTIIGLPEKSREIVLDRIAYPTRSLRVVADRLGISVKTAHDRLKRARNEWPALAAAIPMKSWTWANNDAQGEGSESSKTGKADLCHK
jgi:hypothetical protein